MLSVSVLLLILLSAALIPAEDINCNNVKDRLTPLEHIQLSVKSDIPPKPISGKLVNHCSRFDYTCCNKGLEDKLAEEASRNFKQDLDYVVTAQRAYCTKMKTDLLSAIQEAFEESFLVGIINRVESTNITRNARQLLSPLYNYITQFAKSEDICSLSHVVDLQLLQLAKQVFHNQLGNLPCFEDTIKQYNVKYVRSIMEQLEPLLGKLRYLLKGHIYRKKIVEFMSSYRAPPYCTKRLMHMTFCSICTHGIIKTPCHNLCLNTIQGCLVDFADLNLSVKRMVNLLEQVKSKLHLSSNINHVGIKLQRYILGLWNDSALIKQNLITNNCLPADYKRDLMSNNLYLSPNLNDILPPMMTDDASLTDAISRELKCISHITLLNAPNKMCTERYGTEEKNNNCWSASAIGLGYTAPVADFSRHAILENLNPQFQNVTIPKTSVLSTNITQFSKDMRDMDYQLHCSDDEDCKKFPYLFYAKCEDSHSIEFSGSGDEITTEPTSSGSMPKPRVNSVILTRINISSPPMITHTDSMPTTASPTTESDRSTVADKSDNNITTSDTSNITSTEKNFSPITNNQNSGISILHLEFHHLLLPLLLGMLYII